MEENPIPTTPDESKKKDMLTVLIKTACGVAVLLAVLFCGVFGYIAWSKSKYRRLIDTHDLAERIQQYGDDYLSKRPHAALMIGVIQQGRTETFSFGKFGEKNNRSPDTNTVYEIGSISKVMTALTAQRLVDQGRLNWDNTVRESIPAHIELAPVFSEMTLAHLATHHAGLPKIPDNLELASIDVHNPYKDYGTNDLNVFLASYKPSNAPGRKMAYSNLGFGLLGYICELAAGKPFSEAADELLFQPLHLTNTTFALSTTNNAAIPHDADGQPVPHWDWQILGGAGAFKSTAGDMLKFLAANLHPTNSPFADSLLECQKERARSFVGDMGYGWNRTSTLQGQLEFIWHNGGTGGFVSFIGFDQKHTNAVVMLSNSGDAMKGDFYIDTLAMEILKLASKISLE